MQMRPILSKESRGAFATQRAMLDLRRRSGHAEPPARGGPHLTEVSHVSRIFGPIDQLAWVVDDLDASMTHWAETLGVGPWFLIPHVAVEDFRVDGVPSPVDMSLAIAYSGRLQIELIQQHNDAPSMYKESLDAGRAGQHHIGFFRRDYDDRLNRALEAGYTVGQSGVLGGNVRFTYLRTESDPGTIAELVELNDPIEAAFVAFHQASLEWDGNDPIRNTGT